MKTIQSAPIQEKPSNLWDGDEPLAFKDVKKTGKLVVFERRGDQLYVASDYSYHDINMSKAKAISDADADKMAKPLADARMLNQENRAKYKKLEADIEALGIKLAPKYGKDEYERRNSNGLYLWDESVDRENVTDGGTKETDPDYWEAMLGAAAMAALDRATDYGFNLNDEIGYIVG